MPHPQEIAIEDWPDQAKATFEDSRTYSYHFADAVLDRHPEIRGEVLTAVKAKLEVNCKLRKRSTKRFRGVNRKPWEQHVRDRLENLDWSLEVAVEDGLVIEQGLRSEADRFDIATYDTEEQVQRLWNLCFGEKALADGMPRWESHLDESDDWIAAAESLGLDPEHGEEDIEISKDEPLVLGEIQGGNWGLLYRDLFKLVAASAQSDIDLYVYIVPDKMFSEMISDNTVSYERVVEFLQTRAYRQVLKTPIWVVGVDITNLHPRSAES